MSFSLIGLATFILAVCFAKSYKSRYKVEWESTGIRSDDDSLKRAEIKAIFRSLPWSMTQIDAESAGWLNRAMQILWTNLKAQIYLFIGKNLRIIDGLSLGTSVPKIESMKFIEKDNNILISNAQKTFTSLEPSNRNNMHLLIELSYESDKKFFIKFRSVPLLNRFRLTHVAFKIRLLVTINHTNGERDKQLEILENSDEFLFPIVNFVRFTLVDTPEFDWRLIAIEREARPQKTSLEATTINMLRLINHFILINIINHDYFKYLVFCIMAITLSWFKPSDIRINDKLFLKTLY